MSVYNILLEGQLYSSMRVAFINSNNVPKGERIKKTILLKTTSSGAIPHSRGIL